jgi:hypothetical protein
MYSDGSGEFINKNLDKFLKGKGIKQTVSTPHTSEHNRVVEDVKVNHLYYMVLIDSFWIVTTILVEAVRYACLVHSCTLTKAVDGVTPMEG